MHQVPPPDTFDHRFARAKIAGYRDRQADHQEALKEISEGIRHFDPAPGGRMVETTERYRQGHLDAIARLERWVRMWERDLVAVG